MIRLATFAVLVLSLSICVGPAAAKTWTGGQTAAYTVRVPDGPAYRVTFDVPRGLTFRIDGGTHVNVGTNGRCASAASGDAGRPGATFRHALRGDLEHRRTAAGRGTGGVRWAEFASGAGGDANYDLFAIDPRLVAGEGSEREYYGFEVTAACMSRQVARRLVRTVRITPVEHDPVATQTWTAGQTASYAVHVADGPAYEVAFTVPPGVTYKIASMFEIDGWTSPPEVSVTDGVGCEWIGAGDAHREGGSLESALRDSGAGVVSATGPGAGSLRWAEFASTLFGKKSYDLFALHPGLVKHGQSLWNQYYGFEISSFCMTRARARKLVQTVSITPLAGAR